MPPAGDDKEAPLDRVQISRNEQAKPPQYPRALLAAETTRKRVAYVLAACSWVVCCVLMWQNSRNISQDPRVMVVDGAGVVHYGLATQLDAGNKLYWYAAMQATEAILTYSGDGGYKWAEIIPYMCRERVVQDLNQAFTEIRARWYDMAMSQWVTVTGLEITEMDQFTRATVTGYVDRRGILQGELYYRQIPFTLRLNIVANPRLQERGKWPLVISAYRVDWEEGGAP